MYGQWFRRRLEINDTIPSVADRAQARARAKEFLEAQGFRDIIDADEGISASRGRKLYNLINIGDPRRHAHTMQLIEAPQAFRARILIGSWFALGTKHDTAVFVAELQMLKRFLENGGLDDAPLREAQSKRRKSDRLTFAVGLLIIAGICMLMGLLLAFHAPT